MPSFASVQDHPETRTTRVIQFSRAKDVAGAAASGRGTLYDLAPHQSAAPTMEGA
jgi:hypothetical protein